MEKGGIIGHNQAKAPKTGAWRYLKPEIDVSKCIGCKTCVPHCPEAVMEMRERSEAEIEISGKFAKEKELVDIDYEYCKGCGVCAQVCPVKAIVMKK
ncbi:MAG: 4Fe-4S binding protein [Candidatus Moraniibacteriota bacterium]